MTEVEKQAKVDEFINGMVEDIRPEVVRIESSVETTKGHYGNYMSLLSSLSKDKNVLRLIAMALIKAGANREGVIPAVGILIGESFN